MVSHRPRHLRKDKLSIAESGMAANSVVDKHHTTQHGSKQELNDSLPTEGILKNKSPAPHIFNLRNQNRDDLALNISSAKNPDNSVEFS